MAFQVDLSPLERMTVRQGQALGGLGSVVGEALGSREKRIREDQEQKDLQQLMTRAYEGDEEAIKGVFSKSPQLGLQLEQLERDRQSRYGQEQKKILDENNLKYARQLKFAKTPEDKFSIKMAAIEDPNSDLFDQEDLDQPIELAEFDANVLLFDKLGDKGYEALTLDQSSANKPSSVRETEWFLKQSPEKQEAHLNLKRKTDPTMAEKLELAQGKSDIKVEEAGKSASAKSTAERKQGYIDSGIEAADSLGNINQSLELLNTVETGGLDAAMLRAKQLFGIESADEAQLSAGLGKAILSQLKPIFGAAFTAAEGERLERIEANFGKSTEGNKRLLEQVKSITERAARRGLKAAEELGDEFTAQEIKSALEVLEGGTTAKATQPEQEGKIGSQITDSLSDAELINMYGG